MSHLATVGLICQLYSLHILELLVSHSSSKGLSSLAVVQMSNDLFVINLHQSPSRSYIYEINLSPICIWKQLSGCFTKFWVGWPYDVSFWKVGLMLSVLGGGFGYSVAKKWMAFMFSYLILSIYFYIILIYHSFVV